PRGDGGCDNGGSVLRDADVRAGPDQARALGPRRPRDRGELRHQPARLPRRPRGCREDRPRDRAGIRGRSAEPRHDVRADRFWASLELGLAFRPDPTSDPTFVAESGSGTELTGGSDRKVSPLRITRVWPEGQ